jgi:hypothetical protein
MAENKTEVTLNVHKLENFLQRKIFENQKTIKKLKELKPETELTDVLERLMNDSLREVLKHVQFYTKKQGT